MPITIGGKTYYVPGVYGTTEVINLGGTAIPSFNGLLLIGNSRQGIPYNAGSGDKVIKAFSSVEEAVRYYGVCDLTKAFREAKKGGAGVVYLLSAALLTQASCNIPDGASAAIFTLKPVLYGASGNDIYLSFQKSGNTLTVQLTPPKHTKYLTADVSASTKTLSLDNVDSLNIGDTVIIDDNAGASAPVTAVILQIDSSSKTITVDTSVTSCLTAQYGRVFQQDTTNRISKTFDVTSATALSDLISWINSSGFLTAERGTNTGSIATIANTAAYLAAVAGATPGTSPEATTTATSGTFDIVAGLLPQKTEEFTNVTKARIRLITVLSHVATVHAAYKSVAQDLRSLGKSVMIISGANTGDCVLDETNAAHPLQRAKALNSDEFILAAHGYDDMPAYLSLAPQVAGIISANSVRRNLTRDSVSAAKVEKFFGQYNRETVTEKYLRSGLLIAETGKDGFYVSQGVNTYQKNSTVWNADDRKTYLIQQRQLADFVYEAYKEEMEQGVGADEFDEKFAANKGLIVLQKIANEGFITSFRIAKSYRDGNAVITVPEVTLTGANDFIGFKLSIVVPS